MHSPPEFHLPLGPTALGPEPYGERFERLLAGYPQLQRSSLRDDGVNHGFRWPPGSARMRAMPQSRTSFTTAEARATGEQIGIDWRTAPFDVEQFRIGMSVEPEHGLQERSTNVTDDDPVTTGKIALAHLNEFSFV